MEILVKITYLIYKKSTVIIETCLNIRLFKMKNLDDIFFEYSNLI